MKRHNIQIGIINSTESWPVKEHTVVNIMRFVMTDLGINGGIDLFLTDNATIRVYNRKYRSIDEPTDVLSFSMTEGEPMPSTESFDNIIISWDELIKDADEINVNLNDMMAKLIIHSVLHLSGYDHIKEIDRNKMQNEEKRLIELFQKETVN